MIDSLHKNLSVSSDIAEIKEVLVKFKEDLEYALYDLQRLLSESSIETVTGALKTIINVKSPTFIGALAVGTGVASKIADIPIEWTLSGLALCRAIQIGCNLVEKRNEKRAALRTSPFAYLYHASGKGLILKK